MAEKIGANLENLLNKLHEVYRDCEEQKKRVLTDLNSRKKFFPVEPKSEEDPDFDKMSALAAANNKTYDVLNVLIKNKTEILKIQATLIKGVKEVEVNRDEIQKNEMTKIDNALGLSEEHMDQIREMAKNTKYEFNDENEN